MRTFFNIESKRWNGLGCVTVFEITAGQMIYLSGYVELSWKDSLHSGSGHIFLDTLDRNVVSERAKEITHNSSDTAHVHDVVP